MALYGIMLDVNGDLDTSEGSVRYAEGAEQARQEAVVRCQLFLGEYFLDTRQGVPYFRDILVKNPNRAVIKQVFRKVLLGVPGIVSITSLGYELATRERIASINWEAFYQDGEDARNIDGQSMVLI